MNYTVPGYLTPFIVTGMVAVLTAILLVFNRGLRRTAAEGNALPEKGRRTAFWSIALLLVGYFAVAVATSVAGFYRPPAGSAPTIQYGLLIPIVVGVLLFSTWPLLRRMLSIIPNSWLVGVQFYRVIGVIFLLLYAGKHLPGLFALPAGIGDVLVGIFAPFVAAAYARSPESAAQSAGKRVRLWNLFGITDLVVAVTLGFLTSPSPFQVAAFDRPSVLIGMFPLVLIPVFAVPLSILLHIASLQKLRQKLGQPQQAEAESYSTQRKEAIGSSSHQAIG